MSSGGFVEKLAAKYHKRCDWFDSTRLSGRIGRDGLRLPGNLREQWAMDNNAMRVFRDLRAQALDAGATVDDLLQAIRQHHRLEPGKDER